MMKRKSAINDVKIAWQKRVKVPCTITQQSKTQNALRANWRMVNWFDEMKMQIAWHRIDYFEWVFVFLCRYGCSHLGGLHTKYTVDRQIFDAIAPCWTQYIASKLQSKSSHFSISQTKEKLICNPLVRIVWSWLWDVCLRFFGGAGEEGTGGQLKTHTLARIALERERKKKIMCGKMIESVCLIPVITLLSSPTVAIVKLLAKCHNIDGWWSFGKIQSMLYVIIIWCC